LITPESVYGEMKTYSPVTITGYDYVHFDVYAYFHRIDNKGDDKPVWETNPGSHDSSVIPEPGMIVLLGSLATGLFGVSGVRRRFSGRSKR
jgi:hypothetical protein